MDEQEFPDVVRKARKNGTPEDERKYIDARAGVLKQCHSCGSARKYCSCGRKVIDDD